MMTIDDAAKPAETTPVLLFNQGIRDVVAEDDVHDYQLLGRVETSKIFTTMYNPDHPMWISKTRDAFAEELRYEGATHVFGVRLNITESNNGTVSSALFIYSGDAYKRELK